MRVLKKSLARSILTASGRAGLLLSAALTSPAYADSSSALNLAKIAAIQKEVADKLNDPESARFRNLQATEAGIVCGYVNAKNRFGGYVGFKPFVGQVIQYGEQTPTAMVFAIGETDSDEEFVLSQCHKNGFLSMM